MNFYSLTGLTRSNEVSIGLCNDDNALLWAYDNDGRFHHDESIPRRFQSHSLYVIIKASRKTLEIVYGREGVRFSPAVNRVDQQVFFMIHIQTRSFVFFSTENENSWTTPMNLLYS